jgi:tryptophanyl-tRNA synthetase
MHDQSKVRTGRFLTSHVVASKQPQAMETVFSGIQPSGELHLGNYLGAVRNWVALQGQFRCFYCIVDYHAITQPYEPTQMAARARAMAIDVLACGVDPDRATLFVQSAVPEHTELAWALSAVAPYGELGRMTQFKDKAEHQPDNINAGLFTYPVLQTADILLYGATRVPVGEDQRQHLELAREIVRRFNARFGDTFAEPQPLFSTTPKILGLDGQAKMSKSLGNTIALSESDAAIWDKLRTAATDPARVKRTDPGTPEKCNIYTLHKFFSNEDRQKEVHTGCTTAGIGCIDCKKMLLEGVKADLGRIRARAEELRADPARVDAILARGAADARKVAAETMARVRARLGLTGAGA